MTTKYTEDHEWARQDGDLIVVGITDYAQNELGDIVFVELPEVEQELSLGTEAAVIESVKAAGEVKSPVSGVVAEINSALEDEPEKVNDSPEGDGWFYKVKPSGNTDFDQLMDAEAYADFLESLS
ncbi:MAG: glycine cleavage system protein GcvH [Gammaproteobacteria bacterium]|nr:glycine cleavage system protein GcvH [Gammaproteobacteria bacterium]